MDPDVALGQVRRNLGYLHNWLEGDQNRVTPELVTALDEVLLHFGGLDEFLSNGGFLPSAWLANVRHS